MRLEMRISVPIERNRKEITQFDLERENIWPKRKEKHKEKKQKRRGKKGQQYVDMDVWMLFHVFSPYDDH